MHVTGWLCDLGRLEENLAGALHGAALRVQHLHSGSREERLRKAQMDVETFDPRPCLKDGMAGSFEA